MTTWVALVLLGHVSDGAVDDPPVEPARSHVGLVATIASDTCRCWRNRPIRFDFVAADTGRSAAEIRFGSDGRQPLELAAGRYDVRLYVRYKGGFSYYDTESVEVTAGGWVVAFGCRRGSDKPSLWFE